MGDIDASVTSGVEPRGYRRGGSATDSWDQYVIPTKDRIHSYRGRATTFRTPGRAGTTGQRLLSLYNAAGSSVIVDVEAVQVDLYQTVIKAITVAPPIIRLTRCTGVPANGTVLTAVASDTSLSTSASTTVRGDASADGTLSATALSYTGAVGSITQEYAPRYITAAGYEMADRIEYLTGEESQLVLRASEGVVLDLVYTATTQNPATDMWIAGIRWSEYTRP